MDEEQRRHRLEIRKLLVRRLHELEKRVAILGINTPPEVTIEIADIRERIAEVDRELGTEPAGSAPSGPEEAQPRIVIVSRDGQGDHTTISAAIHAARPGDRILVRPGTYQEGVLIDKPLDIIGDGELEQIVVNLIEPLELRASRARVQGLTLRGMIADQGSGMMSDSAVYVPQGSLILIACDITHTTETCACIGVEGSRASISVRWCRLHDSRGEGIWARSSAQGTVEDCDIYNNRDGAHVQSSSSIVLRNCRIHHNREDGVYALEQDQATIEGCDIFENAKDGIRISNGGNPTVRHCKIHDNKEDGVEVLADGSGTIEQCDISRNKMSGIRIRPDGSPAIHACTITRNGGYAIHVSMGPLTRGGPLSGGRVSECDLRNNSAGTSGPAWRWVVNTVFTDNQE